MKKIFFAAFLFTSFTFSSCDQLAKIATVTPGLSNDEASGGIKEALSNGLTNAVLNLNKTDGFFGSQFYKLLMPPDAVKVENTMRQLGMGKTVDKAILAINRGAEDAVGFAKPIFVKAIKEMTLTDAINIVRGPKDAGTNYFKQKTTAALIEAFSPVVKNSLDKVNATKFYGDVINTWNAFPTTKNKINPDLTGYVVGKATDALFDNIAKEEANIRENPIARTSDLLKKVFGQKW
jgi:Protein of unknown function (DUF4197)